MNNLNLDTVCYQPSVVVDQVRANYYKKAAVIGVAFIAITSVSLSFAFPQTKTMIACSAILISTAIAIFAITSRCWATKQQKDVEQKNPYLISQLPEDSLGEIFSFLDLHSLHKASQVSKEWKDIVAKNNLEKKFVYKHIAIGKDKWETFYDKNIFKGEKKDEDFDSLPDDIVPTLLKRVPTLDGSVRRVMDNDILVWAFKKAYGEDVGLNGVGNLFKKHFPDTKTGYQFIDDDVKKEWGDKPLEESCWVLFTMAELEGGLGKSYKEQQDIVEKYAKKTGISYEVSSALIATICILAKYCLDGTRLFSDSPWRYTRCKESILKYFPVVVGGFAPGGLRVDDVGYDVGYIGVAGLREFKVLGPRLLGN